MDLQHCKPEQSVRTSHKRIKMTYMSLAPAGIEPRSVSVEEISLILTGVFN